ncbi:MAG: gamma-glutamyl-gamma-aminobutyrate hydrolase family protein, partial [Pseudohongiellaceae bacterium]
MKKDFLIIKTGNTVSRLLKTGEDFEDWIIAGTGLEPQRFITASIFQGEPLPDQEGLKGIFITGSPAYLTDGAGWNQVAAKYLRDAAATEIPVLGICYGHQLLAFAFGGEVGFHPRGREMGTTMLTLL